MSLDDELALRHEAMGWLAVRTNDGEDPITREELTRFTFRGERITLIDQGRGIRKPRNCRAALSVMTVHTPSGRSRPYEDVDGADGLPRYKMRSDARSDADNRAVMEAMNLKVPIIWLVGVAPGVFQAIFPVYVVAVEPELDQFVFAYDESQRLPLPGESMSEVVRRYTIAETKRRLHQPVFRSLVMRAYETQCAVCRLRQPQLLDAAHIRSDSDAGGIAAVRNGLALCKIHHAAYDVGILGITPDYQVEIRDDILAEVDGPLFEHGIKGLHGQPLMALPRKRADRPDPELLGWRYVRFRSA